MKKAPQLPGMILMGAQQRLLPPMLPFVFFLVAVVCHAGVWLGVIYTADDIPSYAGGPGPVLAVLHLLTLGVMVATAIGAAIQLLPVATGLGHKSLLPAKLLIWLFLPGLACLLSGFFLSNQFLMSCGALLITLTLMVFLHVITSLLWRSTTLKLAVAHAWISMAALFGLLGLGVALVLDFEFAWLMDHESVAAQHMVLAACGFMGFLAVGFGNILVPMFALSQNAPGKQGWVSYTLLVTGLAGTIAGLNFALPELIALAAVAGLAGAALHIKGMVWCLENGMRKKLGLSFFMIKGAWGMMLLSIICGFALALDLLGDQGPALFGFVLLFGWLLTYIKGMLQRIVPFLAAMNMSKRNHKPPRLSELAQGSPLKLHAICHGLAIVVGATSIALDQPDGLRVAGLVGFIGAAGFAWFCFSVLRSFFTYHRTAAEN
ncbi:MAG: hypothetical protein HOE62_12050 [Alphaproteobacteria bacterium]|jgi:hypothetical protein|nr:hypothetical protein [Alphaproteobacteria bacterium]MBT4018675.1 hypothetical protein [Alphaproteobacteria bacterium]MBT5161094.1 hypothetical protein [Alphaproteobacteria bacterium]MBT6386149.1 hypothetical protein [Alphaproteobacteria bacterium]